jgi:hypothetical protein
MSAMAEEAPATPERPSPSRAHWMLALRHVAWPVLIVAYPLFQWAGWGSGAWLLCAGMWSVQRLIQAGVNRFVLDLPPTPAVAVAGVAFLTRAWGTIIALVVAERTWDSAGAVHAAILFAVLYTIDSLARGLAWAESKREPKAGTT